MRARVLAPLVAALVGVAAGTITALVTIDPSDGEPDKPATIADPLGLGLPLVQYECTGEGLLVLGYGDTSGSLREAMAGHADLDLSYLETAESCDTQFGPERFPERPTYAVVAGPYADLVEPCTMRMTPDYGREDVTALREGNEILAKCVCVLGASAAPVLVTGMDATEVDTIWIRSLQQMLVDRSELTNEQVSGVYDARTEARIREIQATSSVESAPGVVDAATWELFKRRTCDLYEF